MEPVEVQDEEESPAEYVPTELFGLLGRFKPLVVQEVVQGMGRC